MVITRFNQFGQTKRCELGRSASSASITQMGISASCNNNMWLREQNNSSFACGGVCEGLGHVDLKTAPCIVNMCKRMNR